MYSRASLYTGSLSTDFADTRFSIDSKKFRCTLILYIVWSICRNSQIHDFFMSLYNNSHYTDFEVERFVLSPRSVLCEALLYNESVYKPRPKLPCIHTNNRLILHYLNYKTLILTRKSHHSYH